MVHPSTRNVDGWTVQFTDRSLGDFSPTSVGVEARRAVVVGNLPVLWLRQAHGANVVVVDQPTDVARVCGASADAAVSTCSGLALSVVTADCAPIALVAGNVGAVVHAGWHGIVEGVIEQTVEVVRALVEKSTSITAVLGPFIHPASYEFGEDDLGRVAARYGDGVRSATADGRPALDLRAAVLAALSTVGVVTFDECAADTSSPAWFSHRTRTDRQRQALFLWRTT